MLGKLVIKVMEVFFSLGKSYFLFIILFKVRFFFHCGLNLDAGSLFQAVTK